MKLMRKRFSCDATWSSHVGWQCTACTSMNPSGVDDCELCHTAWVAKNPSASSAGGTALVTGDATSSPANNGLRPLLRLACVGDDRSSDSSRELAAYSASRSPLPSRLSLQRRSQPRRHRREETSICKVDLNTQDRVLGEFKETPAFMIRRICLEGLLHINPRGQGCCKFHICAAALQVALHAPLKSDCESSFTPRGVAACDLLRDEW